MGFEQVHEAMGNAETAEPTTSHEEHSSQDTGTKEQSSDQTTQEIIDIASLQKFRFKDREYTPKDLEGDLLRQRDYTKKTQELAKERETYAQHQKEQEFHDNLKIDLQAIVENPNLIHKFLEVYPAKFHSYLDLLPQNTLNQIQTQNQGSAPQQPHQSYVDPTLAREVYGIKQMLAQREQLEKQTAFESDSKTKEAQLDAIDARCQQSYKHADPETVLAKFEWLNNSGKLGDPKDENYMQHVSQVYERLWKMDHEKNVARFEEYRTEQAKEQKRANAQGRDMGAGGGIPSQAPQKMKLKDVKNHILSTLER